jgi:integrase
MSWPDPDERLLQRYVDQLGYKDPHSRRPCSSVLRSFQQFVVAHAEGSTLSRTMIQKWLRAGAAVSPAPLVIRRAQIVHRFLDWLVANRHLGANPFAELRRECRPRGLRTIVPALLSDHPEKALAALRPLPPYGSHLGAVMQAHVMRMRALGYRYNENRFLRFDRFVQQRSRSQDEPIPSLVRDYAAESSSPAVQYERLKVGRILVRELQRSDPTIPPPAKGDRLLAQAVLRQHRRPYIFSMDELSRLFHAARTFPSPDAPLRPRTLYTMLMLGYCAGLRVGEIVRLRLCDLRQDEAALDIRETKFYKSRRLPLQPSVWEALADYLTARAEAGVPPKADEPLFCHAKGGYAYATAEYLLRQIIRSAGLKPEAGRRGPRVHDLRHSFVVHRMLDWYRRGLNPQSRLPYLATYLGHRGIHSTLVYLTITQELLAEAGERFRNFGVRTLTCPKEDL